MYHAPRVELLLKVRRDADLSEKDLEAIKDLAETAIAQFDEAVRQISTSAATALKPVRIS